MNALLLGMAMLMFQMVTSEIKTVVHLAPNSASITPDFGGKLLELANSPTIVNLPVIPPAPQLPGHLWSLDIKNLGPRTVRVLGKNNFSMSLVVGQTAHIVSDGTIYALAH